MHQNIDDAMEEHVRDKKFSRISVTNTCLTIKGSHFSFATGNEWHYVFNHFDDLDEDNELKIIFSQSLPASCLQIALAERGNDMAFLIKNEPSSRQICLFERQRRHVLLLEMINDNLILAKLRGDPYNYWTFIDTNGNLKALPSEMKKSINGNYNRGNISLQILPSFNDLIYNDKEWKEVQAVSLDQRDGHRQMLVFTNKDPLPTILAIWLDTQKMEIDQMQVFKSEDIVNSKGIHTK